jgi:hypothetical protein
VSFTGSSADGEVCVRVPFLSPTDVRNAPWKTTQVTHFDNFSTKIYQIFPFSQNEPFMTLSMLDSTTAEIIEKIIL